MNINTFLTIGVVMLVIGLFIMGTAFNNATKWRLGKAVNVSRVGVLITIIGLFLSVIGAFIKML